MTILAIDISWLGYSSSHLRRHHPNYVQSSSIFRCLWRCLYVMSKYKSLCYIKTYHRTSFQQELPWWSTFLLAKMEYKKKLIIFSNPSKAPTKGCLPSHRTLTVIRRVFLCLGGLFSTSVPVVLHGNCAVVLWFWSSSITLGTNKTSLVLWRMSRRGNVNKEKAK